MYNVKIHTQTWSTYPAIFKRPPFQWGLSFGEPGVSESPSGAHLPIPPYASHPPFQSKRPPFGSKKHLLCTKDHPVDPIDNFLGPQRPPFWSKRPPFGSKRPPSGSKRPPSGSKRPPSGYKRPPFHTCLDFFKNQKLRRTIFSQNSKVKNFLRLASLGACLLGRALRARPRRFARILPQFVPDQGLLMRVIGFLDFVSVSKYIKVDGCSSPS